MTKKSAKIGIVGGAGPYAGLDLAQKLLQQTVAKSDQDYLPTLLISTPGLIEDRTDFLLGLNENNPADAIYQNLRDLEELGATVAGIACNTAHAPEIHNVFLDKLKKSNSNLKLVDMISGTADFLRNNCREVNIVGVLSTIGTWKAGFYPTLLGKYGFKVLTLNEKEQLHIHREALFNPVYGIKVQASPVSPQARKALIDGFNALKKKGAQAIILGCTEIPLGIPERVLGETYCIDPGLILARTLIKEFCNEKLLPWNWNEK